MILLTAARIKAEHRVSFADAIVAAYAIRHDAKLIHRDSDFDRIAGLATESLPRCPGATPAGDG